MKKILMCTATVSMIADFAIANKEGAYIGLGMGNTFVNANTKINATGEDGLGDPIAVGFGTKKLKDARAVTAKLFGGYEFDLSTFSVLTETGFTLDDTEAKHNTALALTEAEDSFGGVPVITSTRLKRNYTFSVGAGIKKVFTNKVSTLVGIDVLYSRFEIKTKGHGNFTAGLGDGLKKKSGFGIAPWVGASYDLGFAEAGLRYQYSKYQTLKNSSSLVPGNLFDVSNRVKPEYHTVIFTVSKKF